MLIFEIKITKKTLKVLEDILGLGPSVLGPVLGLGPSVLGLGLGLRTCGLVNITDIYIYILDFTGRFPFFDFPNILSILG